MFKKLRGQSVLEYALILVVIAAAIIAMQFYMRRGVLGRMRESSDQIGDQYAIFNTTYTQSVTHVGTEKRRDLFGVDKTGAPKKGVTSSEYDRVYDYSDNQEEVNISAGLDQEKLF